MRIEYLPDGAADCPLIRLFDFEAAQVTRLRGLVSDLAAAARTRIAVHELPGAEALGGCRLTFEAGPRDLGILNAGPNAFRYTLVPESWHQVAGLLEPFCETISPGVFQWLDVAGDIRLLLSSDGRW